MPTYNQEKYIGQAIEGVLMQKTDFGFRLIVHDDASSDNTSNIIREYEKAHTKNIESIFQTVNQYSLGRPNSVILIPKAISKYIAICEGDDYWTDPFKLQKQVDFLEQNDDYSMCFHEADVVNSKNEFLRKFNEIDEDKDFSITDLIKHNDISTASVVFRRKNIEEIPELFYQLHAGDWGLHIINARNGKIRYLKDCMSVYRQHDEGLWASLSHNEMILKGVEVMEQLDKLFNYEYHEQFKLGMEERLRSLKKDVKTSDKSFYRILKQKIRFRSRIKRLFNE